MPPRIGRTGQVPAPQQCLRSSRNSGHVHQSVCRREFSQSSAREFHASCKCETRLRRNMFAWLNGPGRVFREPLPGSTNYLSAYDRSGNLIRLGARGQEERQEANEKENEEQEDDPNLSAEENQARREAREAEAGNESRLPSERVADLKPFPINQTFQSQRVLSDELREEIYKRIVDDKLDLGGVSALFGVDMRRVAAVVRLKTIEKDWAAKGKKLATPYADAVMEMLPQTKFNPKKPDGIVHESINDLPVHPYTRQQIFYPTSESRQFTRADAAKVFSPTLLPADQRIPLPELIEIERDAVAGVTRELRLERSRERSEKLLRKQEEKERKQREWEAKNVKVVDGQRWAFRFQNINVEDAGKDGRGKHGVGWRYGDPHHDRKRGAIKIPTSVD